MAVHQSVRYKHTTTDTLSYQNSSGNVRDEQRTGRRQTKMNRAVKTTKMS